MTATASTPAKASGATPQSMVRTRLLSATNSNSMANGITAKNSARASGVLKSPVPSTTDTSRCPNTSHQFTPACAERSSSPSERKNNRAHPTTDSAAATVSTVRAGVAPSMGSSDALANRTQPATHATTSARLNSSTCSRLIHTRHITAAPKPIMRPLPASTTEPSSAPKLHRSSRP